MRSTTTLIVTLTLLVTACGYGAVGSAGEVPEVPGDPALNGTLGDPLTTPFEEEGEPSEPEITLTDLSGDQTTHTVIDGGSAIDHTNFDTDDRVDALIVELAATIESGGDLRPIVSERGLYLVYNAAPVVYSWDELDRILTDETTRQWPSHLVAAADPAAADLPYRTFAEEIGQSFLEAFEDPGNQFLRNEWSNLDEKGIPEEANPIPGELRRFDTVSITDAGHDGIEWFVWYVSVDYEDGRPRIVGLTFHAWTP